MSDKRIICKNEMPQIIPIKMLQKSITRNNLRSLISMIYNECFQFIRRMFILIISFHSRNHIFNHISERNDPKMINKFYTK
jgi:hypothetical protein